METGDRFKLEVAFINKSITTEYGAPKRKLTPAFANLGVQRSRRVGKIENALALDADLEKKTPETIYETLSDGETPDLIRFPSDYYVGPCGTNHVDSKINLNRNADLEIQDNTRKPFISNNPTSSMGVSTLVHRTIRRPKLPNFVFERGQRDDDGDDDYVEILKENEKDYLNNLNQICCDELDPQYAGTTEQPCFIKTSNVINSAGISRSLKSPKSPDGMTSFFMMPTENKRRDSVVAVASNKAVQQSPAKQRKVSSAPNPAIPKRRVSVMEQLTPSNGVPESHLKMNLPNSIKEMLRKDGILEYQVTETVTKIDIPIYTITNGDAIMYVTDYSTIEAAIHRVQPTGMILKGSIQYDSEETNNINEKTSKQNNQTKSEVFNGSGRKMPPKTKELVTDDVTKQDIDEGLMHDIQPIDQCITEMEKSATDYQVQLTGCETIGKYAKIETVQVLLAKQEAIKQIFISMEQFSDKLQLQKTACRSLLQMASASEANCGMICRYDGINLLINTFRSYSENIDILRTVLTIWGYVSVTEDLCYDMIQSGVHSEVLGAISRRSSDADVVKQCCFILGNLVITEETARQIMLVGGVHTVISVIHNFPDDPSILENGCRALGSFAAFDDTCLDVAQAGGTSTVLSVLSVTKDNITVQECGLWALACLTSMSDTCEELVALEGMDLVYDSLETFKHEETIQEYGVRIICNLASLDTTCSYVTSNTVLDILVTQLTVFSDSYGILDHAMSAIGRTVLTIENQRSLLHSNGIRTVIDVMEAFPEHPGIQQHGCRILGNMAVYEQLRKQVESCGASKAVIGAMLSLEMSPDIQEFGCMALMNLTADVYINKIKVMKNGGVGALLICIRNFENDADILLIALKTLANIIGLDGVCYDILEENGLRTIVHVCTLNHVNPEIRVFSAIILCGLSALPDLSFDVTESIDQTLMFMLGEHSSNPDVCLYVCQAMEKLVSTENGLRIFINDDRITVVLRCMAQFNCHVEIQQTCCKIIAVIAMECDSSDIITPDSAKYILQVMKTFKDNSEIQIICCGTLCCMLENNYELSSEVIKYGGKDCLVTALEEHPDEHRLHVLALMVLGNLASSVPGERFNEVHRIVLKTMERFTENHEIQIYALTTIGRLGFPDEIQLIEDILASVRHTLRRHPTQNEVLKSAGLLLRSMFEDGHDQEVENILESALPTLPDFFWNTVKHVKPPIV